MRTFCAQTDQILRMHLCMFISAVQWNSYLKLCPLYRRTGDHPVNYGWKPRRDGKRRKCSKTAKSSEYSSVIHGLPFDRFLCSLCQVLSNLCLVFYKYEILTGFLILLFIKLMKCVIRNVLYKNVLGTNYCCRCFFLNLFKILQSNSAQKLIILNCTYKEKQLEVN